ncbi:hypothetical protein WN55_05598 [Dufourea novaeangliae]|uniref:Uncharacterized protein n=2 Tax=Dufourea novaeangliae TaxID=178035 RepID=A0A154PN68_DUFNO|nr:hypothetical protein WN55_05598 [Dufourea novaeangliae]
MKALDTSGLCNTYHQPATPRRRTSGDTCETPLEMPDLESIIREFEMGFLSPTKHDTEAAMEANKQKNFVKKIVAAFEVKYKTYNDLKTAQEAKEIQDENKLESSSTRVATESWKRRSGIFGSPFKSSSSEDFLGVNPNQEDATRRSGIFSTPARHSTEESKSSRRSGIFGSPFRIGSSDIDNEKIIDARDKTKDGNETKSVYSTPSKEKLEDPKSNRRSGILSSPFNRSESKDTGYKSDIYTSPVILDYTDPKESSSDSSSLFKFDTNESRQRSNFRFTPIRVSSLDDTQTLESIDLDVTLPEPEETIFLGGNGLPKTSTMINEIDRPTVEDVNYPPRVKIIDRTPKIVGAFLKKPIEVEDTSIDWIPITGKKLPRKRSLKKLLSSLTGKKSFEKKSKLFTSERNLTEEPRELQDSGYDERSCSSSSLTSLVSITEILLQQENSCIEPEKRRTVLRTFLSRNSLDEKEDDETFQESHSNTSTLTKKKLLLTEVPREQVKLDLGPAYPPSSKILTMSLDRKSTVTKKSPVSPSPITAPLTRVPKHPHLSGIPKHPFVSLTKLDESREPGDTDSVIVKNDLYEVEFRRSCVDISSTISLRSSSSEGSNYDVPRRFLSKSETEIPEACQVEFRRPANPVYDVPRHRGLDRPRSSVYEDALSLKRRSAYMTEQVVSDFYAFPSDVEPHYATVKPRCSRIHRSRGALLSSVKDITVMEKTSVF